MDAVAPPAGPAPSTAAPRLGWLDANRVLAALGVVLIHSTTDVSGQPYTSAGVAGRVGPAFLRSVAELSGSEIFLVFSLFLLASKLDRKPMPYGALVRDQASKLLIPFAGWTIIFAFFRLFKAAAFGYSDAIWSQLQEPANWVGYFLVGNAQYHLHFMPTLFCLVLLSPLMAGARRFPLLGLTIVGSLFCMETIQTWLWETLGDTHTRYYIDQAVKNLCFAGYGLAAFAIHGLWKRQLSADESRTLWRSVFLCTVIAYVGTLVYIGDLIKTGEWVARRGASFYAHYLMPVLVFACFFAAQHRTFSPRFAALGKYTLGLYLAHPIAIDVFDVVMHWLGVSLPPTVEVLAKFAFAIPVTLALVFVLGKVPGLARLVGLESRKPVPAKAAAPA
jgi:surface polysaccharide O-acyltransferase-like enzyme